MDAGIENNTGASSSSSASNPPMENDWEYLHGRVDPGTDESVVLVEGILVKAPEDLQHRNRLESLGFGDESLIATWPATIPSVPSPLKSVVRTSHLTGLPSELIDLMLSFLGPIDLVSISSTCRLLNSHSRSDLSWQRHVQENIPGVTLSSPAPCKTYRELYVAHDPYWFMPKYKIWFSNYFLTGKIIIIRYDPRRGCIEGYRLVCERPPPTFVPWEADDEVLIHSFEPMCRLHLDQPVVQLDAVTLASLIKPHGRLSSLIRGHRYGVETPMPVSERTHHGVYSNLLLARPVDEMPNMNLWPPQTIPARHRVRNESASAYMASGHKPSRRSQVSDQTFRIRRWMEMGHGSSSPGTHLGEEVYTYATLDPKLYTPTAEKPFRGIWVGDFSGHGCEFLLFHQPDDKEPFDETKIIQTEDETPEEYALRRTEAPIYRGSLEAIKLTGDPNVPRGEYTFISDDLSDNALIRRATEKEWPGARIVKSRGHIATTMFRNDKYIESQLIMISNDRLAQYWVGFGHISFYERVNIDDFLSPFSDPKPNNGC